MPITRSRALFLSCLLLLTSLFSADLYNPSLPAIAHSLHTTQAFSRSLVVLYLFGLGVSQLIYGPLSDRFGRRPVILIALIIGVLGNALSYFAHSGSELLVYRFMTALGLGGGSVISRAIIRDMFQDKPGLSKAFSVFAMSSQLSPAFAPIIGGFVQEWYHWQANFFCLAVLTFLSFVFVLFLYKETNLSIKKISVSHVLKAYGELLRHFELMLFSVLGALEAAYTFGYYSISPFVFQKGLRLSASENGLIFFVYAIGIVVGAFCAGKLTKWSQQKILSYSYIALLVVSLLMWQVTGVYFNVVTVLIFGFFSAALSSPVFAAIPAGAYVCPSRHSIHINKATGEVTRLPAGLKLWDETMPTSIGSCAELPGAGNGRHCYWAVKQGA